MRRHLGGTEPLPTQTCSPQPNATTTFTTWWALVLLTTSDTCNGPRTLELPQARPKADALVLAQPGQGTLCPTSATQEGSRGEEG